MAGDDIGPCPHALVALAIPAKRWATRADLLALLRAGEAYLRLCPVHEFSLEVAAREAGLSRHHFLRLFKETYGKTPYRFLVDMRLDESKARLSMTCLSVAEVSVETGFVSSSAFARAFKRHTGMTPSEWRLARPTVD